MTRLLCGSAALRFLFEQVVVGAVLGRVAEFEVLRFGRQRGCGFGRFDRWVVLRLGRLVFGQFEECFRQPFLWSAGLHGGAQFSKCCAPQLQRIDGECRGQLVEDLRRNVHVAG